MDDQKELYTNLTPLLNCKDNTVSGKYFEVMTHEEYEMLVTSHIPKNLENYYKIETYI
jgi:deoxycytidylate deaminase